MACLADFGVDGVRWIFYNMLTLFCIDTLLRLLYQHTPILAKSPL